LKLPKMVHCKLERIVSTEPIEGASLPVRGNLAPAYVASLAIAILMAIASVAGLLYPTIIYPTRDLLRAFLSNDVVNLLVGVPILLASMWLARRRVLVGLLCWPGALFYVLYNYLVPLFCMPLNVAFLLDLALVMLSVYTIIGLVASIDGTVVRQRLIGAVPEKAGGAVLAGLGILFFVRVTAAMINALLKRTPVGAAEAALNVGDFLITPAWMIGGVLLWRRQALGYSTGLGLLFQASMLFIGLIVYMILEPFTTGARLVLGNVLVVSGMGLVFFLPFGLFLRGVAMKRRPSSTGI